MEQRTALWIIQQAMSEMGLAKPAEAVASEDPLVQQFVSILNRCGNDLVLGYPWEKLDKELLITTVEGQADYTLPTDWAYFLDQTQWDRTNHSPLLGPKSAQEWQWLKGGLLSSGPALRYRVWGGKFNIFPTPASSNGTFVPTTLSVEYISNNWLMDANVANTTYSSVNSDTDISLLDPWVVSSLLKLKYWEAKGLDTTAYTKDFLTTWNFKLGKDKGAPMLSLAPRSRGSFVGFNSVPDGSWNIGNGV